MENLSHQRQLAEMEETDETTETIEDIEETRTKCYFTHYSNTPSAMKATKRDRRIPTSFKKACEIPKWAESIDREYNALVDRQTWKYVKWTADMKPIPFIWDFRIKDTVGSMAELLFKARCCLRGDKQVAYRDFDPEILYAPVVRHETIRVFIVKSSAQGLIVRGADVDNAYLYGNITNGVKIYMQQPTDSSQKLAMPGHVCQLEKSLYGLRQAGEIWGQVIHQKFTKWGFQQSNQDPRQYLYQSKGSFINLILVVDYMAYCSNDEHLIEWFEQQLKQAFKVKLLGNLKAFIGWEFSYTDNGLYLGQEKYVRRLLTEHDMQHVKAVSTPLPTGCDTTAIHYNDIHLNHLDHKRYRSLVGGLSYLAICTRPDISYAIPVLSRQL